MQEAIERPVFGVSIRTIDGFEVTGAAAAATWTACQRSSTAAGHVDVRFDPVRLLPGTYDVSVSLTDYTSLHIYDVRIDLIRFDVERGRYQEPAGVVALGGVVDDHRFGGRGRAVGLKAAFGSGAPQVAGGVAVDQVGPGLGGVVVPGARGAGRRLRRPGGRAGRGRAGVGAGRR